MEIQELAVQAFRVPGGEGASLEAYERLVELQEQHEDLLISVYRGINQADGTWALVLMGELAVLSQYAEPIELILAVAQVEPIKLSLEEQLPLIEMYLEQRAAMWLNRQTIVKQHYPLSREQYTKQKARGAKKKRKRR
jgi:hypothetical protein